MPLKIRPNAIEQEEGDFIFPGVISLVGTSELSFDANGVTGSALVSSRDTSSGFFAPVTVRGSVVHLVGNEQMVALRVEEGGGQGWLRINPTAKDYDLSYLADDGTVLLYGDAGSGRIGIGTDAPQRRFVVADSSVNIGMKNTLDGRGWSLYAPGGAIGQLELWAHHDAAWTQGEYVMTIYPTGSIVFNPVGVESRDFLVKSVGQATLFHCDAGGHSVGIGTSATNRLLEISNQSGEAYVRIDGNSGSAVQLEYSRDGNYAWVGPTAGGDFHIWSQESGAIVVGVNNAEVMRATSDGIILPDDKYFQFGQFTTGSAAWPAEPAASDWIIFGQDMADSFDGITPYFRGYGAGPWEYPQPLISRSYEDYRVTDSWHAFGDPAYYIAGQVNATALTSGAPAINEIHFIPFFVNQRFVVTKLGFYVTVAGSAGSVARVGIYNNKRIRDSGPNNLLYDGGEKSTTSTGAKETTGLSVELVPGMYWFAYLPGVAAPTIRCLAAGAIFPNWGLPSLSNTNIQVGRIGTSTYGALPALGYGLAGSALSTTDPIPAIYFTLN